MSAPAPQTSPVESLTQALIDANDQLLALYDMTTLRTDTLDEGQSVEQILCKAKSLLRADDMRLVSGTDSTDSTDSTGTADDRGMASIRVSDPSGDAATLLARRSDEPFSTGDGKLLTAVAHLAMHARHTARMHAVAVEQAIVAHEHTMASELVQMALPKDRPDVPGAGLFAHTEPARTAGGDLFTFSLVDRTFHFVVGDVSGKGLPAAILMSSVINAATRSFTRYGADGPVAVLDGIDALVYDSLSDADMFVTLIAGRFDADTRVLSLANAGHSPVHFVRDGHVEPLAATRPPIGVLPGLTCERLDIAVEPSDRFIAASDGFPEQVDESGTMFGEARFAASLLRAADHATSFGDGLFAEIEQFAGAAAPSDDRTLFVLDFGVPA